MPNTNDTSTNQASAPTANQITTGFANTVLGALPSLLQNLATDGLGLADEEEEAIQTFGSNVIAGVEGGQTLSQAWNANWPTLIATSKTDAFNTAIAGLKQFGTWLVNIWSAGQGMLQSLAALV